MIHHITRATRHLIFWGLIAAAIGMTGVRLALTGIEDYKIRLSDKLGELLGAPVAIGRLGATMRGFSPELVLSGIDIASAVSQNKTAIALKEIRLGIDLLDVLVSRELLASSWITLVGAKLSITRKLDDSFAIVGLKAGDSKPLWLLQGGKYEVLDSDITWQDEQKSGRPLTFESVDMALINEGERHRINILMRLPKKYGETLRVSMDVIGNVFEPTDIRGNAYIEGERIRLPAWVTVDLPFDINVNAGSGDFKVWGEWRHSKLESVIGSVQINELKLQRRDTGVFPVDHMKSRFHLRLADERWQLDIKQFLLETPEPSGGAGKKWPEANFSVAGWRVDNNPLKQIALYAENLDLQEASLITQFFIPAADDKGKLLRQAQFKGALQNFSLFAVPDEKAFAVNGTFTGLSVASMFSVPGLENLTGRIRGDEKQGIMQLASKEARFISDLFRGPLAVDRLNGALGWEQTQDEWVVSSPLLELDSMSFKSKNRMRINIAKADGQTFMDLQSAFACENAAQAPGYFPVKIMKPAVVNWLDHAFIKGRVPKGSLLFYGKLKDFPFTNGTGVFETLFDVDQLELEFHPLWPHLTDINGEVLFYQDSLTANLYPGLSDNVKIKQAEVAIPSLAKSEQLLIKGELEGEIGQALAYLQKTPLNPRVDKLLDATLPEGDTQVKLDLKIPVRAGAGTKVDGSARLNNAKLRVISLDLPVNQVTGLLQFNEKGVHSDTLKAHALGHPIQVNIKSADRKTVVNVEGRAGVSDLQSQFKMPWWRLAEGATDYRLQLSLPYDESVPELNVQSNLTGMALNLPDILAKKPNQQKPVSLRFNLSDKFSLPLEINYDNVLKAAVKIDIRQQAIDSGHILLGPGTVTQRQEPGIKFEISRDKLALQDWIGLSLNGAGMGGKVADIREIKVHSEQALWHDSELGRLDLALQRDGDTWDGTIGSRLATGRLKLPVNPKGTGRIVLNLDTLDISALKMLKGKDGAKEAESAPEFFPLLSVSSKNTLWESASLGKFIMETERSPEGLLFKQLELTGADQKLSMTGAWQVTGKASLTQTQGRLEIPKPGRLFSKLGISNDLTETSGVIDFALDWQAPPYQFSLSDLQGRLDVNFKSGRILSIEPGFGRVLGILAMAQWIKRLQLDFSDIYEEGLTFNSIKGHFDLAKGKAVTHNLVVDAVPAKITISGETDLINRTVDHVVNVAPKSADAVPIAGTIMGKVAAFVAKSLTGAEHEGLFFGSQYLVKGGWGNAQISSMHENEGLLQKTWNGITDFPWLKQQDIENK
jgi:uncharacterized protein (TIGR02099 family)